jgi:dTDP-4-amino-4,6-dideoxygalactose transaminase
MWKVQLFELNYDDREQLAAEKVIKSGWLTMGEHVVEFEREFERFLGEGILCTAVSNGTAALHMAVLALDIRPGDEVIIPALTFVADANVVVMSGAKPVLADCASLEDWNISAESIESKITRRTRAVMVLHYGGFPCHIEPISEVCRQRGIALIEDVAHAPGATVGKRKCGSFGDVGCFSFFSNKNLSIGEGGMVATRSRKTHDRLRQLRSHGMSTLTLDRHKGRAITYDVGAPGLNYRIDEVRAAIGLVQLAKLEAANSQRARLSARYRSKLANSIIKVPFAALPNSYQSAHHLLPTLLPAGSDRTRVIEYLKTRGIQSSIHYPAFWDFTAYRDLFKESEAPVVAEICKRELTLPLYPTMGEENVDLVTSEMLNAPL